MQRLIRVFPRRTAATPTDELAYTGPPDLFSEADRVHVSVTFTWDIPEAERLAKLWERIAPVEIGGPAFNQPSGEFEPGRYLAPGYTITSRGCPNKCWFCAVWKREKGQLRELPIRDGWNVLDDNLLACSESHVRAVFAMLGRQRNAVEFTGGLEAAKLQPWHAELLAGLPRLGAAWFAYDEERDWEPLLQAGKLLDEVGLTAESRKRRCYVLIGFRGDTLARAERRLINTVEAGFAPMAMLMRDPKTGLQDKSWKRFQETWARPSMVWSRFECVGGPSVSVDCPG